MHPFFRPSAKSRVLSSRLGSLLLLFQRSPLVQLIFPEARLLGGAGLGEITKWTVATVVGLGAYDSVSGATTINQVGPDAGSTTVPAKADSGLSFVFQLLNYPATPGSWTVSGALPAGLTHSNAKNNTINSITGVPTQAGSFPITIKAWAGSNGTGSSFSRGFTIVVAGVAPTITNQPDSTTINSGGTTTLTVAASGTSPTFQWYRGASGVTTSSVSGATSASFTTPPLSTTTSYWVRASNSEGAANSNAATVTVRVAPAITNQPDPVTINSGQTATFTVVATGTSPTFQWYQGDAGDTTNPVTGGTSATFTTAALTETTSFWVRASNAASAVNSITATATVITPPLITAQPVSTTTDPGNTVTFTVAASGTAPTFQWYQGTSPDTANPVAGATGDTFTTPVLTATSRYWVRSSNAAGVADSGTATITVNSPPAIISEPPSSPINSGGSVTLMVAAAGTAPTLQWYLGNTGDVTQPILDATSPSFTTPALTETTRYWVRATNGLGIADSQTAVVTVQFIPVFTTPPISQTINSGATATFSFVATGEAPTFQWYQGNSGDISQPLAEALGTSFTTPALTTATSYWVRASNVAGDRDSATVSAKVISPPLLTAEPVSLTLNSGQTTTLTVTASGTSPDFQWYLGNTGDLSQPILNATAATFTTPALTATTGYWVRASNPAGTVDSATITISVITPPQIITAPTSLIINPRNTATLTIQATGTAPIYQWYLGVAGVTTNPVGGATFATFTTPILTATTRFWVRATNPAGTADSATAIITVRIPPAITRQPKSVTIASGKRATLKVVASGTTPTYQWFKGAVGNTKSAVKGAKSATLTTPALKVTTSFWVRISNPAGSVKSKAVVVTVKSAAVRASQLLVSNPRTFVIWQNNHFTLEQLADARISGSAADPDGDGISNAQEYLYGLPPLVSSPAPLPDLTSGVRFTAKLASGPGYAGLTRHYALEAADTAGHWTTVSGYSDIVGKDQAVTYTAPAPHQFYRLRVWLTP